MQMKKSKEKIRTLNKMPARFFSVNLLLISFLMTLLSSKETFLQNGENIYSNYNNRKSGRDILLQSNEWTEKTLSSMT